MTAVAVAGGALSLAGATAAGWLGATQALEPVDAGAVLTADPALAANSAPTGQATLAADARPAASSVPVALPATLDAAAMVTAVRKAGREAGRLTEQRDAAAREAAARRESAAAESAATTQRNADAKKAAEAKKAADAKKAATEKAAAEKAAADRAAAAQRAAEAQRAADAQRAAAERDAAEAAGAGDDGTADEDATDESGAADQGDPADGRHSADESEPGRHAADDSDESSGRHAADESTGRHAADESTGRHAADDVDNADDQDGAVSGAVAASSGAAAGAAPVVTTGGAKSLSQIIDPKNWYLTLPTGKEGDPDTIPESQLASYRSKFFDLNPDKSGLVFTANTGGATTSGSQYPRSELREMNGSQKASWDGRKGTHTMDIVEAITRTPKVKPDVIAGQIHATTDDLMQIHLSGKLLRVKYADGKKFVDLDPDYKLGATFAVRIQSTGGRVKVWYNGALKADLAISSATSYFKAGVYTNSNPSKGASASDEGQVVINSLTVRHT